MEQADALGKGRADGHVEGHAARGQLREGRVRVASESELFAVKQHCEQDLRMQQARPGPRVIYHLPAQHAERVYVSRLLNAPPEGALLHFV